MSKKTDVTNTTSKNFESKFNPKRLKELIDSGADADEIQEELGIVSKQSLRQHVLRLINEEQKFIEVKGLYSERAQRLPMINFKGELKISSKNLSDGNFSHGDKFNLEVTSERITLTKISSNKEPEKKDTIESAKK
ncbi:hypothetical protein [Halodesulfovibrio marinisediminis]|uniref:Uncharacterized protein n=1 Tax=Halodesulfovibrio marinisediminis DSM 17456 TaxID=1121457 RepID=A0A1N6FND8_9BACT|nr:hypothetical protein [Halodesulfovibrio marinisediminis]SIN96819.1 hypothetical protein SAMN02745161_1412 [Halodesulfovibrio marinisediminis DSM 17456]